MLAIQICTRSISVLELFISSIKPYAAFSGTMLRTNRLKCDTIAGIILPSVVPFYEAFTTEFLKGNRIGLANHAIVPEGGSRKSPFLGYQQSDYIRFPAIMKNGSQMLSLADIAGNEFMCLLEPCVDLSFRYMLLFSFASQENRTFRHIVASTSISCKLHNLVGSNVIPK